MACFACAICQGAQDHRVFALMAAMGDRFSAVHEVPSIGSHLPPFRRRALEVPGDGINKLVLKGLGDAVSSMDPAAERVYLSVRLPRAMQDRPSRLPESAFDMALEQLRGMPHREAWHRILVATPAYRAEAHDGLASGMEGMGLFTEPLCQSGPDYCDTRSRPSTAGVRAKTLSGESEAASRYLAPFLFAKISILDPVTLQVLDVQEIYDHDKIFDPDSGAMEMNRSIDRKVLATRILERVESSALEAVRRSELRGSVDVREHGEAPARR